jgi:hypothetical protein
MELERLRAADLERLRADVAVLNDQLDKLSHADRAMLQFACRLIEEDPALAVTIIGATAVARGRQRRP